MSSIGTTMDETSGRRVEVVPEVVLPLRMTLLALVAPVAVMVLMGLLAAVLFPRIAAVAEVPAWLPWSLQIGVSLLQIAGLVLFARIAGVPLAGWLGLRWPAIGVGAWIGIIVALFLVKAGVAMIVNALFAGTSAETIESLRPFAETMATRIAPLLITAAILGAIVEELLFRGVLSPALEATRLGAFGGAVVASLLWAVAHYYYPAPALVVLVVIGVVLSHLRRRTGSILPGMAWHVANNVVALGVMAAAL